MKAESVIYQGFELAHIKTKLNIFLIMVVWMTTRNDSLAYIALQVHFLLNCRITYNSVYGQGYEYFEAP